MSTCEEYVGVVIDDHLSCNGHFDLELPPISINENSAQPNIQAFADFELNNAAAPTKGADIFTAHSGIWHLHHECLARYHMPPNTDCNPMA